MAGKHRGKKTGRAAGILENVVDNLRSVGFEILTRAEWLSKQDENTLPEQYVVRNWPHQSLYGGRGKKEALIVSGPCKNGIKFEHEGEKIRIVVEAKYQSGSGSVDEKFPFVWESFLASEIPNWILLYDGKWWLEPRGMAAVKWIKDRYAKTKSEGDLRVRNKTFYILNRRDMAELIGRAWR